MLRPLLTRLQTREDNLLAAGLAWTVGMLWFVVGGFYFGCIVGSNHVIDLQVRTMAGPGLVGALAGLLVGAAFGLFFTFVYPRWTAEDAREEARELAHHDGHHDAHPDHYEGAGGGIRE